MTEFQASEDTYGELKLLGQQYRHYMKLHINSLHELTHLFAIMTVYLLYTTLINFKNLLENY